MKKVDVTSDEIELFGRIYKEPESADQPEYEDASITVHLQKSNLRMGAQPTEPKPAPSRNRTGQPDDDVIFGLPIDVDLAAHLIKNAICAVNGHLQKLAGTKRNKASEKAFQFIKSFLDVTSGITYDKTVILQILSQPNCEGLRAYPCSRSSDKDEASLVLVGVDANGFDLNYPPTLLLSQTNVATPTTSIIVEYGFPPTTGPGLFSSDHKITDNLPNYTLLKLAYDLGCAEGK